MSKDVKDYRSKAHIVTTAEGVVTHDHRQDRPGASVDRVGPGTVPGKRTPKPIEWKSWSEGGD